MATKMMKMIVMLMACFCLVAFSGCEDDDDDGDSNGGSGSCDMQDEICADCAPGDKTNACNAAFEDCEGNEACCEEQEDEMIIFCEV
jgi:hypothetical protein